jgi:hypothetical protein
MCVHPIYLSLLPLVFFFVLFVQRLFLSSFVCAVSCALSHTCIHYELSTQLLSHCIVYMQKNKSYNIWISMTMNIPIMSKAIVIKKIIESLIIDLTNLYIFLMCDNEEYEMFAFLIVLNTIVLRHDRYRCRNR